MYHIRTQPMRRVLEVLLHLYLLVACGIICCNGCRGKADNESCAAQPEPFMHERRAALATDAWGGMRVEWTVVADWPTGNSPVAKSVRAWIDKRLCNYHREPFSGDSFDWDAMTRFYGSQFLADNGANAIESNWRCETGESGAAVPEVKPGADVFLEGDSRWFCNRSAIIKYEDERIVSYRSGFCGFFVGNVTSAAYVKCATFRKLDGKLLGWDVFTDTNAVFELVRQLAKVEFKKGADLYETSIPMPAMPLFTNDGFWCFWGGYAIVEPHVYEMKGEFPSLFVPWRDPTCGNKLPDNNESVECWLTREARLSLIEEL